MSNNNMTLMREYSLVLCLMLKLGEGCKVCYGDREIDAENLGILYEMLFTGIQLETLRLEN